MKLYVNIHRQIGDFDLNIKLESNAQRIGILGASGSGKSMTLKCIAGIDPVDEGKIVINDRVLFDSHCCINLKPQARHVGYMFQNYALFPTMTVLKNVIAGLKGNREENRQKAMSMLKRVHMEDYYDHLPSMLSGGQQQRVALARIMVTHPDVILLDEPFSALDEHLRDRMQVEMLEMLENYPGQVIMVSHNRDELYRFAQELLIISDGQILTSGPTRDIFANPRIKDVARLTGCKNIAAVNVINQHTLTIPSWQITIHTKQIIPDDTHYIGYRAHYFIPVWGESQTNCLPFTLVRVDDLPFEKNYYFGPDGTLCWFVQEAMQNHIDELGLPDYLQLDEQHILFLT